MTLSERALRDGIEKAMEKAIEYAVKEIQSSIDEKGISNSGALRKSIRGEVLAVGDVIQGIVWAKAYAQYHDQGVAPKDIPYTIGGRGNGGKSKYIEGLVNFFLSKGLVEKEAKGAAFGTATLHKRYGSPLNYMRRYGRGSHFITERVPKIKEQVAKIMSAEIGDHVRVAIKNLILRDIDSLEKINISV